MQLERLNLQIKKVRKEYEIAFIIFIHQPPTVPTAKNALNR